MNDAIPPDVSPEDNPKIEEPHIRNRRELHQFLEWVMTKTYELEREYQRLEEDVNMVKSYIIESHAPLTALKVAGYGVRIAKTEDPTLCIVKIPRNSPLFILTQ